MIAKAMKVDATARRSSGRNAFARPAADHRGDERDVDRVEGRRGEPDLEGEPPEALVRDRRADGARGRGAQRVDRRVEEDADGRLPPDHLHEQLRDDADDDRRRPAVDRRRSDDEDRGERRPADGDVLDRDREGLDEGGRDEQRHHPGERRRRGLDGGQRRRARGSSRGCRRRRPARRSGRSRAVSLDTRICRASSARVWAIVCVPANSAPSLADPGPGRSVAPQNCVSHFD